MFRLSMLTPLAFSRGMMMGDRCWGALSGAESTLSPLSMGEKICANPSFVKMHAAGSESFYVFM